MRTKRDLKNLNLRREMQRRLQFSQKRMRETVWELSLAKGEIATPPKGMKRPPPLALAAARLAWTHVFGRLEQLKGETENDSKQGAEWELIGIYRSLESYVSSPPAKVAQEERQSPALTLLRKSAARQVSKKFAKLISKLQTKFHCRIPAPTAAELIDQASRYKMGVEDFVTEDGGLTGMKPKMARIYYLLWFYWPDVEHRFTTLEIHHWLANEHGESPSDKTVEAILTALRKDAQEHPEVAAQP